MGVLAELKFTTLDTTLAVYYARKQLHVDSCLATLCSPKVSQTSRNVQSPIDFPHLNNTQSFPSTTPNILSKILAHRPQEVVFLDSLPPLVPHGLGQAASCLSSLHRSLHTAVSTGEIHTLLVERHLGHERIRILERALAQGFGGALTLFL